MLIKTYEDEASSTMPPFVHLTAVRPGVIFAALIDFVRAGENLNRLLKKPFVYGPTRAVEEDQHHPYVGAVDVDPPRGLIDPALAHGIIGVATESAELVELLIKTWFYNEPLDGVNAKEEIGDILWYLVRIARAGGVDTDLEEAMKANIAKLANRHKRDGKTFNPDADKTRDLEAERALLEAPEPPVAGWDEQRGIALLQAYDDGSEVWLESYAGGASPGGLFSALRLIRYTTDGKHDLMAFTRTDEVAMPHESISHEKIERIGNVEVRHRIYENGGKPISAEEADKLFQPRTIEMDATLKHES